MAARRGVDDISWRTKSAHCQDGGGARGARGFEGETAADDDGQGGAYLQRHIKHGFHLVLPHGDGRSTASVGFELASSMRRSSVRNYRSIIGRGDARGEENRRGTRAPQPRSSDGLSDTYRRWRASGVVAWRSRTLGQMPQSSTRQVGTAPQCVKCKFCDRALAGLQFVRRCPTCPRVVVWGTARPRLASRMGERWLTSLRVKDDPADGVPRPAPYRVRFAPSTRVTTIRPSFNNPLTSASTVGRSPLTLRLLPFPPPSPQEPVELASFSKSRAQGDTYDKSQLKRYFRPSMPFDLSEGFDTFRDRDRNNPGPRTSSPSSSLSARLAWTSASSPPRTSSPGGEPQQNPRHPLEHPRRVAHGGGAGPRRGCPERPRTRRMQSSQGRPIARAATRECYWGFSFEEACTGGTYDEPIDCMNAYCAVVRAGVGRHRLILGGEVDCWDGQTEGLGGYVELKTTRIMETASQVARFERDKLLKWWAQSFAVGVRRIIVGFRDDDGAVRKLQTLETLKLPGYAARHPGAWDPKTALQFADKFLTWLRAHLGSIPEGSRVRVEYEPRRRKHEIRATVDPDAPDFVPARARKQLERAAGSAPRRRHQQRRRPKRKPQQRLRRAGGSAGGGERGGGSVGGGGGGGGGGTAAAAKRRANEPGAAGGTGPGPVAVVFKEPEPRATTPRGSGSTAGATPPAKKTPGGGSGTGSIPSLPPRPSAEHAQNRISDDPSSDPASASLVERFVHWYGNEGARAPDRRRRRRHERSQTPVPGSRPRERAVPSRISPSHRRRARVRRSAQDGGG